MRANFQSTKDEFLTAYLKETIDFKATPDSSTLPTQDLINTSRGPITEQSNLGSTAIVEQTTESEVSPLAALGIGTTIYFTQ
jgi:hypothetical protein